MPALSLRSFRALFAFCVAALFLLVFAPDSRSQSDEYRAFWIDAFGNGFKNSSQVATLINDIRAANANMIIPQIRKRGDAYYSGSPYEPKASDINASFDPLQDMITKAHDTSGGKRRIDVHGWIVSYKIWGSQFTLPGPSTPPHPLNAHPEWLTQDVAGEKWDGMSYSFDPGHPEVQEYTYNLCMDIISRYDLDGFNFDYIRYTGNTWGYHPVTVERFNSRFGRTGQPSPTDPLWLQFRRDQVTALVRKVYLNAIALKPHIKISADTITWGAGGVSSDSQYYASSAAYNSVLQDWRGWMQEGILDINIPMNYYREHEYPLGYLNWMNFAKDRKFDRHVVIGPGIYLNYTSNAIAQMRATRDPSPSGNFAQGLCGYVYKQPDNQGTSFGTFRTYLTSSPNPADSLTPAIFSSPVNVPVMPWKAAPVKGHLKGFVYGANPQSPLDGAVIRVSAPANRGQTNDATGFYGFVDLAPGSYTLTVTYPGYAAVSTNVTIAAGQVATRDIVLPLIQKPEIVANPQSKSVYVEAPAAFRVTASGAEPLRYQWQLNGANIPGATNDIYSLNAAGTNDAGSYTAVVANNFGSITSAVALLTVIVPPPSVRLIPLWSLAPGDRPYVTAGTTERGLAYNPVNNHLLIASRANGARIFVLNADSGADLHELNMTSVSGGTFAVNMLGVAEDGVVYAANLTTDTSASILKIYRWQNDNASTPPTLAYSGAVAPGRWGDTLDVRGAGADTQIAMTSRNGTQFAIFRTGNGIDFMPTLFNVQVSGGDIGLGVAFASPDSIWTKAPSANLRRISFNLANGTAQVLQSYSTAVTGGGVNALGAHLELGLLAGVAIETPDNLKLYDVGPNYSVSLAETNAFPADNPNSNNTGSVDFDDNRVFALATGNGVMAMRVTPKAVAPSIAKHPASLVVNEGNEALMTVEASGSAPLSYQWHFNGGPLPGANAATLERPSVLGSDAGDYLVVVTNSVGSVTSTVAVLSVRVGPSITLSPQSRVVRLGQNATLNTSASGTGPLGYQWYFEQQPIPGAISNQYTIVAASTNEAGSYHVVVSNVVASVASQPAVLTVQSWPVPVLAVTSLGGNVSVEGDPGTYTIEISDDLQTWHAHAVVPSASGKLEWTDPDPVAARRFYRVTWSP